MQRTEAEFVIVGGGIWGLSTAYHLAAAGRGRGVLVLERNEELAGETTRQSAGQVGQLRADLLLMRAIGYTRGLLARFRSETGHDPGFVSAGSLHLALCEQRADVLRQLVATANSAGVAAEEVDATTMRRLAPDLRLDDVVAGVLVPSDGYVNAVATARALAAAARDAGVCVETGTSVTGIEQKEGHVTAVKTSERVIATDNIIVAAGPWTGQLAESVGCPLPYFPIRLQQGRTVPAGVAPAHPVVRVPDVSCYIRPEEGGYLYGFFDPDPLPVHLLTQGDGFRTSSMRPDERLLEEARHRLGPVLPALEKLPVTQYRQGMITGTPDGRFVLGRLPGVAGLWVATGCGGTGVAASGAVGRWLAAWCTQGNPGEDLGGFDPARFGERAADRDWICKAACQASASYYRLNPDSVATKGNA